MQLWIVRPKEGIPIPFSNQIFLIPDLIRSPTVAPWSRIWLFSNFKNFKCHVSDSGQHFQLIPAWNNNQMIPLYALIIFLRTLSNLIGYQQPWYSIFYLLGKKLSRSLVFNTYIQIITNYLNFCSSYSWLLIIRTLANSNLALNRTKVDFPWISFLHLL